MTVAISTPEAHETHSSPPTQLTQRTQLTQLSDDELLQRLNTLVARDRAITAALLAHLAEVDERRLYAPAGYSSMHAYCVGELRFSDDEAYKRIRVARATRVVPALLDAFAESRVSLTAAKVLAPHITSKNAEDLIGVAASRNKLELEQWIAQNFGDPRYADSMAAALSRQVSMSSAAQARVVLPRFASEAQLAPGPVEFGGKHAHFGSERPEPSVSTPSDRVPLEMTRPAPIGAASLATPPSIVTSIPLKLALSPRTYEKLLYARSLLAHSVPSGDPAQVFDRALDALIALLEKQKFSATDRPRTRRSQERNGASGSTEPAEAGAIHDAPATADPAATADSGETAGGTPTADSGAHAVAIVEATARKCDRRRIPAEIRRAVRARDGGCCTFVSDTGHRCGSRDRLEFDHVTPVARGGDDDVSLDNLRLRCRAHNQYEAERAFGRTFMNQWRAKGRAAHVLPRERERGADGASLATSAIEPPG